MIEWKETSLAVLKFVTSNAHSPAEMGAILFASAVGAMVALKLLGKACNLSMTELPRCAAAVVVGFVLCAASAVAVKIFAIPKIPGATAQVAALAGVPAVVLLAAVVPFAGWMLKGRYAGTAVAVLLATAAAACVSVLLHAAIGAASAGGKSMKATKQRTEQVEDSVSR